MDLNQNEYTMASLGFNYQKPPLFLLNQTHPFLIFPLKVGFPPPSHRKPSLLPPPSSFFLSSALIAISGGHRAAASDPHPYKFIIFPFISLKTDAPTSLLQPFLATSSLLTFTIFLCFFTIFLSPKACKSNGLLSA